MAEIEVLLRNHLKADANVAAKVGTRIWPAGDVPQLVASPYMCYQVIDRPEVLAKPSNSTLRIVRMRVQLDVFATGDGGYASVKATAKALKSALYKFGRSVDASIIQTRVTDEQDMSNSEEGVHRISVDASITFNE
jgi:hypothetical protein